MLALENARMEFKVSKETRIKILDLMKNRPSLWKKTIRSSDAEWDELKREVFNETGVDVSVKTLKLVFRHARITLHQYIKRGILLKKMNKEELERRLRKWKFYPHFSYYRSEFKENEEKWWKMQMNGDEEDEDAENMDPMEIGERENRREDVEMEEVEATRPIAIVIRNQNFPLRTAHRKIKLVDEFVCQLPSFCKEALRADLHGSHQRPRSYPGIPNKKFSKKDLVSFAGNGGSFPIQCVAENLEKPGYWLVFFEGWTMPYEYKEKDLMRTGRESLRIGKMKVEFLNAIREKGSDEMKNLVDDYRKKGNGHNPSSFFWDFNDLSYFHSIERYGYGLGQVFYMAFSKTSVAPPNYKFTSINVMNAKIYAHCLTKLANRNFSQLGTAENTDVYPKGGCENEAGCVCDRRFDLVYGGNRVQYLQTKANGLLDLSHFNPAHRAISIECSDSCGCSSRCPRRQMQNPQPNPLVVFYEGSKRYGLRAGAKIKKGALIGEYNGELKKPRDGDDHSYEAGLGGMDEELVICSRTTGNVIRFMSHSCEPSAFLAAIHTRVNEEDPLLPRLAVYASKELGVGDEITIKYNTKEDLKKAKNTIQCLCFSANCMGRLPA